MRLECQTATHLLSTEILTVSSQVQLSKCYVTFDYTQDRQQNNWSSINLDIWEPASQWHSVFYWDVNARSNMAQSNLPAEWRWMQVLNIQVDGGSLFLLPVLSVSKVHIAIRELHLIETVKISVERRWRAVWHSSRIIGRWWYFQFSICIFRPAIFWLAIFWYAIFRCPIFWYAIFSNTLWYFIIYLSLLFQLTLYLDLVCLLCGTTVLLLYWFR